MTAQVGDQGLKIGHVGFQLHPLQVLPLSHCLASIDSLTGRLAYHLPYHFTATV